MDSTMHSLPSAHSPIKGKDPSASSWKQSVTIPNVLLVAACLICFVSGFLSNYLLIPSIALTLVMVCLLPYDEFYVLIAIFLLFLDQLQLSPSLPVYRLFSFFALAKIIFHFLKIKFSTGYFPALLVFFLYTVFAMGGYHLRSGLSIAVDVFLGYLILLILKEKPAIFQKFLLVFVVAMIASGLFSLIAGNVVEYAVGRNEIRSETIVRYFATLGDPNYAGFFYDIAIIIALNLKMLRKWFLRIPTLLLLYYLLLLTNSLTAFICNILLVVLFIILRFPKQSPLLLGVGVVGFAAIVVIVVSVPALRNIDFIHNVIVRVSEQIRYFNSGRIDMATSDRSLLWEYFLNFFKEQSWISQLFGGNIVTSYGTESKFFYQACHMVYLQGLLTFGILGSLVVFGTIFIKFIARFFQYFMQKVASGFDLPTQRILISCTAVWIFYGFSIDYLMDWRFLFFFFL